MLTSFSQGTHAGQKFFVLALCLAKCSVLCLFLRLLVRSRRKLWIATIVTLGLAGIWGLASILALCINCSFRTFATDPGNSACNDQVCSLPSHSQSHVNDNIAPSLEINRNLRCHYRSASGSFADFACLAATDGSFDQGSDLLGLCFQTAVSYHTHL